MWDELKAYFDKYDKGAKTFLREDELKAFVIEVLHETSQRELDYVFWNLFRVDNNANKEVDFTEFVIFVIYRLLLFSTMPVRLPYRDSIASRLRERVIYQLMSYTFSSTTAFRS